MCGIATAEAELNGEPCDCYEKGRREAALEYYSRLIDFARHEIGVLDVRREYPPARVLYSRHTPKTADDYMQLWIELRNVQPSVYRRIMLSLAWTEVKRETFQLEPRICSLLTNNGLTTVIEVHKMTNRQLLDIKGIGKDRLLAIRVAIWREGLATAHAFDATKGERLAHPIRFLQLTGPVAQAMESHGIISIGDIVKANDEELLAKAGDWRRETVDVIRRRVHAYLTL